MKDQCFRKNPKDSESFGIIRLILLFYIGFGIRNTILRKKNYLKWHYRTDTICKHFIIERPIAKTFRNFWNVSETIILRENVHCHFLVERPDKATGFGPCKFIMHFLLHICKLFVPCHKRVRQICSFDWNRYIALKRAGNNYGRNSNSVSGWYSTGRW